MSRVDMLEAKSREITDQLKEWAESNLRPGEQLLVSLHIQDVPVIPVVIAIIDDRTIGQLLDMKVLDYFTPERLNGFTAGSGIHVRTRTCLKHDGPDYYDQMSLGEFVEQVSEAQLLRTPNFGRGCLALVSQVLNADGLKMKKRSY